MMNTPNPTRPIIKGNRTRADDHGYRTPPHVSPITTDVVDPVTRMFPLQASEVSFKAHDFISAYIISIFLSFSRKVAGGVLRRKKSRTRVALKAHIGRLRSASFCSQQLSHY